MTHLLQILVASDKARKTVIANSLMLLSLRIDKQRSPRFSYQRVVNKISEKCKRVFATGLKNVLQPLP